MQVTKPHPNNGLKNPARRELKPIIPALAAIIGVLLLLYPVFATQHNDIKHQENARNYSVKIEGTDPAVLEDSLAKADEYNRASNDKLILDPFLRSVVPNTPQYQAYLKQLDVLDAMAQIKVPTADIDLPVYHGTEDGALNRGAGHLFGTSLPVGGEGTHSVITGHTGLSDATLFNNLKDVKVGDAMYLKTEGRKLKYIVTNIQVVLPTQIDSLRRVPGKDLLTLITCTPYGINSHRLLVTGERAPLDEADAAIIQQVTPVKIEWKWWMIALIGVAIISIIVITYLFIQWQRAAAAARRKVTNLK